MTRKKVTPTYISNDSERKASYKKRKKGLIKKVSELSTLCGVDACIIIYSQYNPEAEVWPSHEQAQAILARFRKLSDTDKGRKMVNQETFTSQRIKKAVDQLRRLQRENKLRQVECYMYQCIAGTRTLDDTHLPNAAEMNWVINKNLRIIQAKLDALMALPPPLVEVHTLPQLPPLSPSLPPVPPLPVDMLVPPMEEDNMDGFPWNLVESPTTGLECGVAGLEVGDFGWDPEQPYPYILNPSIPDQQGNQGNDFNNFNNFNN